MLIDSFPSYSYFANYIKPTNQSKILDFGSNWGNFLNSSPAWLEKSNYTGIDVDQEAIEEGRKKFPQANWYWYNRYNPVYNPTGEKILPQLNETFDFIISYSVFTHMDIEDTLEVLDYLYSLLNPGGSICFSYCNIDRQECVDWFRVRRENCDQIPSQDYVYLINNKTSLVSPSERVIHFVSFYKTEWLLDKLAKFNPVSKPPHNVWMQDAIIITK